MQGASTSHLLYFSYKIYSFILTFFNSFQQIHEKQSLTLNPRWLTKPKATEHCLSHKRKRNKGGNRAPETHGGGEGQPTPAPNMSLPRKTLILK